MSLCGLIDQAGERVPKGPREPLVGVLTDVLFVFLKGHQIVQWIFSCFGACLNQTRENRTHKSSELGSKEQGILALQNRCFQGPFYDVMPPPRLCRVAG